MKRRDFITAASVSAASVALTGQVIAANKSNGDDKQKKGKNMFKDGKKRDLIEIRTFWTQNVAKRDELTARLDETYIPLCKKLGYKTVGVFVVNRDLHEDDKTYDAIYDNAVFVVGSTASFETFLFAQEKAVAELKISDLLNKSSSERLYEDMECELLLAFPSCPQIEVPTLSKDRVVQYRRYNSPNIERHRAKVRMFDVRGELALFRKVGINPVFFGDMIYGKVMPNLSYMVSFENDATRRTAWSAFIGSDEWKTMKAEPEFKDTATRIRNLFLKPSPHSEI